MLGKVPLKPAVIHAPITRIIDKMFLQWILWHHHQVPIILLLQLQHCECASVLLVEAPRWYQRSILIRGPLTYLMPYSLHDRLLLCLRCSLLILRLPPSLLHACGHVEYVAERRCDD